MAFEVVESLHAGHYGGIELAVGHSPLDVFRLLLHNARVHLGVLVHHLREKQGNEIGRYGWQHADGEGAGQRSSLLFYYLSDAACLIEHLLGLLYHGPAIASGHDGLAAPVENLHVQFGLQLLNHGAQRGLRDIAGKGSLGKVAIAVQGQNVFQLL